MSLEVQKKIVARIWGQEGLDANPAAALAELTGYLAKTGGGNPAIRYGSKGSSAVYPEITFRASGGVEALGGVDVGIIERNLYHFEIWDNTSSGLKIPLIADCLERLFDCRRDGTVLPVSSPDHAWWGQVETALQGPFHDDNINAWFGLMAFQFVEARP